VGELSFATAWEVVADTRGDRLALHNGGVSRTWAEFDDRAARLARALSDAGVDAGSNVALALYNGNEYMEAEFAAFKVRAAPCNVNYRYVEAELRYLITNSEAKAVFFDHALAERFGAVHDDLPGVALWIHVGDGKCPEWASAYEDLIAESLALTRIERDSEDLWILYTGGTTGHPKGVMWPHGNLMALVRRSLAPLGLELPTTVAEYAATLDALDALTEPPRQLAASPLMHGTAGIGALFTMFQGGAVVTLTGRSLDSVELWETVAHVRCSLVSIVGDVFCAPMVDALDEATAAGNPFDLSSVRSVSSSGVMWSQPIKDRLLRHARAVGSELLCNDSLGASEGVGFAGKESKGDGDTETATFTLGPNAAVFNDHGSRVEPGSGEIGLLAVSGPIPVGYFGDPVKSAETFREMEGQRWSIPGDFARIEADGTLVLLGRGSVSINTGGEKVFPEEVEEALKLLAEVSDANVVGVPDPKWGSAVTAVVELIDGAEITDQAMIDGLRSHLSGYKLPKNIVRVDSVFRAPNGKADYKWATAIAKSSLGMD
jgi:3-oxocholest-4-en-26-oate---CoA ligase